MKCHIVRQGENLQSIAQQYFADEKKIWEDVRNSQLREKRRDQNCLLPGDLLHIPENQHWFTGLSTGQTHTFVLQEPEDLILKVSFRRHGKPLADCEYELEYEEHLQRGTTDANGKIEVEVSPDVDHAVVTFPKYNASYRLDLRHLDPVESPSGIQGRLRALGHYFGRIDGVVGSKHRSALECYRRRHGIQNMNAEEVATHIYLRYDQLEGK